MDLLLQLKDEDILADEPTGALDSKSSSQLLDVFSEINKNGQTILMVTHSAKVASHGGRVLRTYISWNRIL